MVLKTLPSIQTAQCTSATEQGPIQEEKHTIKTPQRQQDGVGRVGCNNDSTFILIVSVCSLKGTHAYGSRRLPLNPKRGLITFAVRNSLALKANSPEVLWVI